MFTRIRHFDIKRHCPKAVIAVVPARAQLLLALVLVLLISSGGAG